LADTLLGHFVEDRIVLDEQRLSDQELREVDKVFVVACGTAYHSGLLAKYAIEHWTRLPVEVELASEFLYRDRCWIAARWWWRSRSRGDRRHAGSRAARQTAEGQGAGHLQYQRQPGPAGVRRGALHPRRPGDRRGGDQDVPGADRRQLSGRIGARAGPRHYGPVN
jgi:hypothetical protein